MDSGLENVHNFNKEKLAENENSFKSESGQELVGKFVIHDNCLF